MIRHCSYLIRSRCIRRKTLSFKATGITLTISTIILIINSSMRHFLYLTPFGYVYQNKFGKSEQDEDQSKNGKNGMLKLEKVDNLMNKMQERTEDFKT